VVKGLLRPRLERRLERMKPQRRERSRQLGSLGSELNVGIGGVVPRHVARDVQGCLGLRGGHVARTSNCPWPAPDTVSRGLPPWLLRPLELEQLRHIVRRSPPPVRRQLAEHREHLSASATLCMASGHGWRLPKPRSLGERVTPSALRDLGLSARAQVGSVLVPPHENPSKQTKKGD
jgi:hypothetical protein